MAHGQDITRRRAMAVLLCSYAAMTLAYALLGYLHAPHARIAPVDSAYYYMYARSLLIDGDLHLGNEVTHYMGADHAEMTRTETGSPSNDWSVGPSIFWAPFVLLAHGLTLLARFFGVSLAADGYSALYGLLVYVGNSLYALAGVLLLLRTLESCCSRRNALLACMAVMFCTQLSYYFWSLTAMAHNTAFFATALFFMLLFTRGACALTILAGALVFLTRWQAVIYLLPLAVAALRELPQEPPGRWALRMLGLAGLFVLAVSPQFISWKLVQGSFFTVPHGEQYIDFGRLQFFEVLLSLRRGLFAWHPALLFGLAGLLLFWRRDAWMAAAMCCSLALQVLLVASLQNWWGGWAFGQRFFIEALVLFGLGFAVLLQRLEGRPRLRQGLLALLMLLAVWNQLFVFQYQNGLIPRDRGMTAAQFVTDKLHLGERLRSRRLLRSAVASWEEGQTQAFSRQATQAALLAPWDERTVLAAGFAALQAGDYTIARQAFARLLKLQPKSELYTAAQKAAREQRSPGAELAARLEAQMYWLINS